MSDARGIGTTRLAAERRARHMNDARVVLALAQINCTVGDLEGNAEKIFNASRDAASRGADIVVTPELALTGYPPEDLLLRPALYARSDRALAALVARLAAFPDLHCVIGHPSFDEGKRYNSASVWPGGRRIGIVHNRELPTYDELFEVPYFEHCTDPSLLAVNVPLARAA